MRGVEQYLITWRVKRLGICWFCLLAVLWIGVISPSTVLGQESEETHITSDTMTAQSKERRAIFVGSVVLTQGELIVHSDKMVVWWKPSNASSNQGADGTESQSGNKIEKIVATGKKVIITKPTGKAICRQAIYFKDEEKIILTGSPVAWQEGTRVSGSKMTMYLKEDRTEVEGETQVIIKDEEGE